MTTRFVSVLSLILLLAACAAPALPSAPVTTAPQPAEQTLIVFAAASLTESFKELSEMFEAAHTGVEVLFNFAGSQQLRAQLEQGAPADVFASANTKEMNAAIQFALVLTGTQQIFAANRLVVVYPKANPGKVAALADLARPGLKLVIADKAVPVGLYTQDMLAKMSRNSAYSADFADRVQANVVSLEQDVKAVVAKVRLGEVDAGIVYSTDAAAVADEVTSLPIPDQFNQLAMYPIAALDGAAQPELARQFVELVLSNQGQEVLQKYGFLSPAR